MNKIKTVSLLGKGDGWDDVENAPDGHIYGVNDAFLRTPEVTHTFHMHDLEKFFAAEGTASSTKLCILKANERKEMPFFTIGNYPPIPHAQPYPLEEVIDFFKLPFVYFSSGPEYMIAYALYQGAQELNYYGLNMTIRQEFKEQKPGMDFWTGIAIGMGVKVNLQWDVTSLLKTRNGELYGYNIKQWRNA